MSRECRVSEFFSGETGAPRQVVELEEVMVELAGRPVLEGITFSLEEGTFLGIIGPNGAGKTTLMKVIVGLVRPSRGMVRVLGMEPGELRHELHHIGYMPQQVLFDPIFPVSVYDVVMMGRACCIGLMRFPRRHDREAVLESIRAVGLAGLEKRPIGELSGGQQKRAFLARAICKETRILLLDEPTAGLDVDSQENFLSLLRRLRQELGLTVVFVSHDVNVMARFADQLVCINRTMHLHGSPQEVLGSDRLKEVYRCEFDFLLGDGAPGAHACLHDGSGGRASMLRYTFGQTALVGGLIIALICSVISFFVVVRRLAFMGMGISHAAFGGVAIGLAAGVDPVLVAGGFCTLVAVGIGALARRGRMHEDTTIGILFTTAMAMGVVVVGLAHVYNIDLMSYLFGSILAMNWNDVVIVAVLASLGLAFVTLFFKELLFVSFDEETAAASGLPVRLAYYGLLVTMALTIVVSIKLVGIILVSALLVIPGATGLQISRNYRGVLAVSVVTGMVSVVLGLFLSDWLDVASGATIVMVMFAFFLLSLAISPRRRK